MEILNSMKIKKMEHIKDFEEKNKETARNTWDSWIKDLEETDQPETCNIDDSDCEACGS